MEDESRKTRTGAPGPLGRLRTSLRGVGRAAARQLRRKGEQLGEVLDSAAERLKESDAGERLNTALETRRVVKRAEAAHARGNPEFGYRLLVQELRSRPADPKLVVAFWRTCVALERGAEAVEGMLRLARARAVQGEIAEAAGLWSEVVDVVPDARADAGTLVRIVPALQESTPERAVRALRASVDPETPGLTPGLALRVLDLARDVAPAVALRAAHVALESPDLVHEKRAKLEQQLAELEREVERAAKEPAAPEQEDAASIPEVAPAASRAQGVSAATDEPMAEPFLGTEDMHAEAVPEPFVVESTTEAFGELVMEASPEPVAEIVEETVEAFAPAVRFAAVKAMQATPLGLDEAHVKLGMCDGRRARLEYTSIQAVAAAEIRGLAAEPVVTIDLVLNWRADDDETLRVVRLRSDGFDAGPLDGADARTLRSFLASLLSRSEALPLPSPESALGDPFRCYSSLEAYEREVLQAG